MAYAEFKQSFDKDFQEVLMSMPVGVEIAKTDLYEVYEMGQTVKRPISNLRNEASVQTVVNDTDLVITSPTDTAETLTINNHKAVTSSVHKFEQKLRRDPDMASREAVLLGKIAKKHLDGSILAETRNAYLSLDAGDFGGSAGAGLGLTTTNAVQVMSDIIGHLHANDADLDGMGVAVLDPLHMSVLRQVGILRETDLGDRMFVNGRVGEFQNFTLFESNDLSASFRITLGANPTAGDTVTFLGATFKFVASPTDPGDVDLGGSASATADNLIAALTSGAGAGTAYIALTGRNARVIREARFAATNASGVITGTTIGSGRLNISSTDADLVVNREIVHSYIGRKNAIDVALPVNAELLTTQEPRQLRTNLIVDLMYGIKTFSDGSQYFVDLNLAS